MPKLPRVYDSNKAKKAHLVGYFMGSENPALCGAKPTGGRWHGRLTAREALKAAKLPLCRRCARLDYSPEAK